MAALYNIGDIYLSKQYQIDNGGVSGFILNNIGFDNGTINTTRLENLQLWSSYAQEFLFNETRLKPTLQNQTYQFDNLTSINNPNYNHSILMIVWLLTFVILILLLGISSIVEYWKDERDKQVTKPFQFISSRRRRCMKHRVTVKRILVMLSMSLVVILWFIFMIMLCTTQYLISSKLSDNSSNAKGNTTKSYGSLVDALTLSFMYLDNFFYIITNSSGIFLNSSLSALNINIQSQLNTSVMGFGNQVLTAFNITDLFNTAQILIDSISQMVNSMTFIDSRCQNILSEVDSIKGSASVYQNSLNNYLIKICKTLNNDKVLQRMCQDLQTKSSFFRSDIQTNLVDSNSSAIMLSILKQYHINITEIAKTFYSINNEFKMKLNQMFNSSINKFNTSVYLDGITTIWNTIVTKLTPVIKTTMSYRTILSSTLDTVSKYENFITIILILLIFILILIVLLLPFRNTVQDRSLHRYLDCLIQMVFILVLIVSAFLCVLVLIFSNFTQSEFCNQVNTTTGVKVLDQMVNQKLSGPWQTLTKLARPSNQNFNITVGQPMNILSGIKDRCRNTSMGLFSVLEIGNFVNVSQIVHSQSIMTIILNAENSSLKAFLDANPTQIIPQDINSFIDQTLSLIQYFDGINYNASIQELQKPLVGIVNFTGYFNDLSTFVMDSSQTIGWTTDLINLNKTINQLLSIDSNWTLTQREVTNLHYNFQILQTNRHNALVMNRLLSTITHVRTLFNNVTQIVTMFSAIYNHAITVNLLNTVDQIINGSFSMIAYQMIPCGNLSMIFEVMTTTFCSNNNFNVSLASFGILLLIVTIASQILCVLVITAASLRLNSEPKVSKC